MSKSKWPPDTPGSDVPPELVEVELVEVEVELVEVELVELPLLGIITGSVAKVAYNKSRPVVLREIG
jgi:hypothetical protein